MMIPTSPLTRFALAFGAAASFASAQTVLSDFTGPSSDGWTGSINGTTTFANGFTAASGATYMGNDVLSLSDGGFGGGALRTYTGLPTTGFVTISVMGRIDTDPGTLTPDPNSNPGQFGSSFGVAAGNTGLVDQDFAYARSMSDANNNSGQPFAMYAATVRADGSGTFTAFFTPDQQDHAVGLGTWVAQFDDVTLHDVCTNQVVLSDFAGGTDGWASITPTTAPFGSGFTAVSQSAGELVLTDGGYTGGAYNTYVGAAPGAGIHTVLVDVRIVTDNGSIDRARIAASAGGPTTNYSDLSFSQSFSTTGDDSGQSFQTVAVPVITSGADDITVYLLTDYDAGIGAGAWEIHLDNVRVASSGTASTAMSTVCAAGYHSLGGPVLSFSGLPVTGTNFDVIGSNMGGTGVAGLLVGMEVAPVSLVPYGSFAGSQICISSFVVVPAGTGSTAVVPVSIPAGTSFCGVYFDVQWFDLDPASMLPAPFGTSQAARFTIGS